jgi:hypothetical protein
MKLADLTCWLEYRLAHYSNEETCWVPFVLKQIFADQAATR